jgi:hypothetical protein
MRNWKGFVVVWGVLVLLAAWGPPATAQEEPAVPEETPAPAEEPAVPEETPAPAEEPAEAAEPQDEEEQKKMPFGLYVEVAGGTGSSDELVTSIFADELNAGIGEVTLDEQTYGRAAIGWKLPHQKGDFRLVYQGVREEEYEYRSQGVLSIVRPTGGGEETIAIDADSPLVPWWFVQIDDGNLSAVRFVPMWEESFNENPVVDPPQPAQPDYSPACVPLPDGMLKCGEVRYDPSSPDRVITGTVPDDLQNRIGTYDILYGREFGGRRYSSRWWAGLRYFEYEGQLLAGAWLNLDSPGDFYTDGSFLNLLYITQQTDGIGPVGSWEAQFNFFDKGVQFFIRGEAAFTFNSMEMDSGPFFQVLDAEQGALLADRMSKSLDKSTWQDRGEIGARVILKNGLQFELGYSITGYLDFVLMPDLLQIGVTNDAPQTNTQDIIMESAHFGIGFQF